MPRPPLPIGTWGKIRYERTSTGWRARVYFRDRDGITRDVERVRRTKGAARDALTAYLTERTTPAAAGITAEATLAVVVDAWFAENAESWAINTRQRYTEIITTHIKPGLGGVRVREASVPRLDAFIKAIATDVGAPTAKTARTILKGALGVAVRHGAAQANPVRDTAPVRVVTKEPKALDDASEAKLRAATRAHVERRGQRGRPADPSMVTLVEVLLATGARIGEVLALRWSDLDLVGRTVTISGTVVSVRGRRPIRQDRPKTDASFRTLDLTKAAVAALLEHQVAMTVANHENLVFPSAAGTLRDPSNVRTVWRKIVAAAGLPAGTTPRVARKTVATKLDRELGTRAAAEQLGHADEGTTRRHYIERSRRGPKAAPVLEPRVVQTP